ncbi:hypothetical protein J437_LFUL001741 [Ladona fulva]|uniref:Peptidase M14 domain-containing protein n=1 Tax=Ladona fulva TaxID=123851 RepID=A0A8K0JZV9_LADFU|nr:hypothetical protein J437_LFUL001741 [Ladona fulva]
MESKVEGLTFSSNFDSGNLARVESTAPTKQGKSPNSPIVDLEFNLWTKVDAANTEFQNSFRSWFFFSVKGSKQPSLVKFNIQNLNKHSKVFTNNMYPVYMVCGQHRWQRIKEKPVFLERKKDSDTPKEKNSRLYLYLDLHSHASRKDIYYHRECLCHSLEGRSVDLITITSNWGISREREPRLKNLFPDVEVPRPHAFPNKKVIFITARVHPAETSSSFVLDGIITSLINKNDPGAAQLRKKFLFKLIPVLNPDGVVKGHYRTDSRGINLNRVYQNPSLELYPTIYAVCSLIRYYHKMHEIIDTAVYDQIPEDCQMLVDGQIPNPEKVSFVVVGGFSLSLTPPDFSVCILLGNLVDQTRIPTDYEVLFLQLHLDKSGNGSRDGTGRVWVMSQTGITYSYTFEAHYNTGQVETCIPRRGGKLESKHWISFIPAEFSAPTYEGSQDSEATSTWHSEPHHQSPIAYCPNASSVIYIEVILSEIRPLPVYQIPVHSQPTKPMICCGRAATIFPAAQFSHPHRIEISVDYIRIFYLKKRPETRSENDITKEVSLREMEKEKEIEKKDLSNGAENKKLIPNDIIASEDSIKGPSTNMIQDSHLNRSPKESNQVNERFVEISYDYNCTEYVPSICNHVGDNTDKEEVKISSKLENLKVLQSKEENIQKEDSDCCPPF